MKLFGIVAVMLLSAAQTKADAVVSTVPVGSWPTSIAIDTVTNRIYVASMISDTVTVINGTNNGTATVKVRSSPYVVAVNPVTNMIYVGNDGFNSDTVAVLNGTNNNAIAEVPAGGAGPEAFAVNSATNMTYVANRNTNFVTVIDGTNIEKLQNHVTANVAVGGSPQSIAVNPATNMIYVANEGSNNVTVINGANFSTSTIAVGSGPQSIALNPVSNRIYVVNFHDSSVTVINGANNSTAAIAVGPSPYAIAVNPITNMIYVANGGNNTVTVINGANNLTANVAVGGSPQSIAVNPATNMIYVANEGSNNVTVINGATNKVTGTIKVGTNPTFITLNPVTDMIYVANSSSNTVTVINGHHLLPPILSSPNDGTINIRPATLALTWNSVDSATSYAVQLSFMYPTFGSTIFCQTGITSTSAIVPGVTGSNYYYYWRANASRTGDTSAWSSVWSFNISRTKTLFQSKHFNWGNLGYNGVIAVYSLDGRQIMEKSFTALTTKKSLLQTAEKFPAQGYYYYRFLKDQKVIDEGHFMVK